MVDKKKKIREMQEKIEMFVWEGKKPRLKSAILMPCKEQGGLVLPNIEQYYQAAPFE